MLDETTLRLLITAISLVTYKIVILVVGTIFAILGYKLLIKGISGGFKLTAEYKGVKADIISASPGIFFILTGTIIISITLYKGITLESQLGRNTQPSSQINESATLEPPKIGLPAIPPIENDVTKKGD